VPLAIELYEAVADPDRVRVALNGEHWASVTRGELPDKLAEIGRAYASREVAALLERRDPPQ
jgi:hypothetical protein